jgi:hypothetical protein
MVQIVNLPLLSHSKNTLTLKIQRAKAFSTLACSHSHYSCLVEYSSGKNIGKLPPVLISLKQNKRRRKGLYFFPFGQKIIESWEKKIFGGADAEINT